MDGKRCLLISDWMGLNSDEEPVFEFLSNIYKSKTKPIKRCKFVYGLNLTLTCETPIKLCFKNLYVLMLKHVERIEVVVHFHVSSFPLPFLHLQPLQPKSLCTTGKHGVGGGGGSVSWMAMDCFGETPREALVL